ncbi:uncharacterized protein LOC133385557 [Rhineura floridana]|uniref:uncharacterized protein LOC133385557 n=1 Tax=Rhineura floridana TaxID=261503 RepID=UPI002AC85C93|nr:uncharacterized protein LOC133385557 [Rhineura floridana]
MTVSEALESRRVLTGRASFVVCCSLVLTAGALIVSLAVLAVILTRHQEQLPGQDKQQQRSPAPPIPHPQIYAHLVLKLHKSSRIANRTLDWWNDTEGVLLGRGFESSHQRLGIKHNGLYYIYAQITAIHQLPNINEEVNVSLIINHHPATRSAPSPILTLPLHLSPTLNTTVAAFMAVSSYRLANNDKLSVELISSSSVNNSWFLHDSANFFGLYQIPEKPSSKVMGINCFPVMHGMERKQ